MEMSGEKVVGAIRAAKRSVSDIFTVCESCENRSQVYLWTKPTNAEITYIKEEIEAAYESALERCKGERYYGAEAHWSIHNIIRGLEKKLSKEDWKIHASTPYGSGLVEDKHKGTKYYIDGWDSSRPVSFGKMSSKGSITTSKGEKVDKRVLLARHFSKRLTKSIEKGKTSIENTVLVDLGFHGDRRGDMRIYGDSDGHDPLVPKLVTFIQEFFQDPRKYVKTIERTEEKRLDTYLLREVLRLFEDNFRILDCGHLKVQERSLPFRLKGRMMPFEEKLKTVSLLHPYPSGEVRLDDLDSTRQKMVDKIDQLYQNRFVTSAIKKDANGDLCKNEILFLCKTCEEAYLNKYEIPVKPCGGKTCIFKHFLNALAGEMGYKARYIEPYELGLLSKDDDAIVVSRTESVRHPVDNIMLFTPSLFIVLDNFLSTEILRPREHEGLHVVRRPRPYDSSKSNPATTAYGYAKEYLLPTVAYDWVSDESEYVPIKTRPPAIQQIIKTIVSIDYTVGATERAYKAPHDRIIDIYEEMGLEFGFNPVKEYGLDKSRIDVVWLDREKEEPEIGIEVELSGQITNDLWKLCELQPSLGVLVVKGSYYETAVDHVTSSSIVKRFNQRILIFDASEKNFTLIEGSKLVDLEDLIEDTDNED